MPNRFIFQTTHFLPHGLLFACMMMLSGCAQYATVSQTRPKFQPVRSTVGAMVAVEQKVEAALKREKKEPVAALGELLSVAQFSAAQVAKNPDDSAARETYNFAVARILGTIQNAKLDPYTQPLRVPSADGDFILTHKPDPRPAWNPLLYDFTPADQFDIRGKYVKEHVIKEGVGAPIVAIGKEKNLKMKENFGLPRAYYGVTALIRFDGRKAVIAFEDPLATETVTLDGRRFPLAADFTVPIAVMLASSNPKKLELSRLLNPEKYAETARIARLQPYDPNKTVILVVHGLMDTPATWAPMINSLRSDPAIRKNYQFWFYSYPSGYPYPYSASILRKELDEIEKRFPLHKKMVVMGHSMGGCISRLLITDTGDKIWMKTFNRPPAEVEMDADSKKTIEDSIIFDHRPEIGRVIFLSAPLKGSDMASNWLGRIGSSLVTTPRTLLHAGKEMLSLVTFQADDLHLKRLPNSVDTLAPNNRFVKAINTIPVTPGIPHNVISGDRGKGGNKDKTPPVMSDGVVPYWSSHMESAESELVVPSHHGTHQNPEAIAEVSRILKKHAKVSSSR